jgi:endoglucanase
MQKQKNKILITAFLSLLSFFTTSINFKAQAAEADFDYKKALEKSIIFYDAQRSGELSDNNRVSWRKDSHLSDGEKNGLDLSGGWNDAGDNVKFLFPAAYATTMLSWSAIEYKDEFEKTDQLKYLMDNIKWSTDFILKSHTDENELYVQVGKGRDDHRHWWPAELIESKIGSREGFKIDESCPGSDVSAEAAAALASSSIVFRPKDPVYASNLLQHAKELYSFAENFKGKYSDCIVNSNFDNLYYKSWSGYEDELAWGASWMYMATGKSEYLDKAKSYHERKLYNYQYGHNWDDKSYGTHILLAQITNDKKYKDASERFLDYWTTGYRDRKITYTPGGLAWLSKWGSLRYSSTTAFLAFVYSDWLKLNMGDSSKVNTYNQFAVSQINYILGKNPQNRSYMVGFGNNSPIIEHLMVQQQEI